MDPSLTLNWNYEKHKPRIGSQFNVRKISSSIRVIYSNMLKKYIENIQSLLHANCIPYKGKAYGYK